MNRAADEATGKSIISSEPETLVKLRRSASLKLAITARQLRRHFDRMAAELGITRSQWTVIAAVSELPGSTQRTLAQLLEVSEASAGRLVDRLCADGLVLRRAKDEDRRAHCVFLTPAGENLIADLMRLASDQEAIAFAGLELDDLRMLSDLLDRTLGNVGRPTRATIIEAGADPDRPPRTQ